MKISISICYGDHWKTASEIQIKQQSKGPTQYEGSFQVEREPDFIECTFQVASLPRFTITPFPSKAGILTGTMRIKKKLYFATLVPEGLNYSYNVGVLESDEGHGMDADSFMEDASPPADVIDSEDTP